MSEKKSIDKDYDQRSIPEDEVKVEDILKSLGNFFAIFWCTLTPHLHINVFQLFKKYI